MDLKHLRTFVTVAELGTVSKAALRLRIAQPALSRQIIELERELGLTRRHLRKLTFGRAAPPMQPHRMHTMGGPKVGTGA